MLRTPESGEVSAAVRGWLAGQGYGAVADDAPAERLSGGADFWVYGLRFAGPGLPPRWPVPLVARVPAAAQHYDLLRRESAVQSWAAARGYPAPEVLTVLAPGEAVRSPVRVMARVPAPGNRYSAGSSPQEPTLQPRTRHPLRAAAGGQRRTAVVSSAQRHRTGGYATEPAWGGDDVSRSYSAIPRRGHDVHAATLCGGCCSWFAYDIRARLRILGGWCGPGRDGGEPSRSQARKSGVPRFASAETTAACAACAAILPRPRPRSARTTRVSFMTRKGTTAGRGARAAAATRETGPGTTILRRH